MPDTVLGNKIRCAHFRTDAPDTPVFRLPVGDVYVDTRMVASPNGMPFFRFFAETSFGTASLLVSMPALMHCIDVDNVLHTEPAVRWLLAQEGMIWSLPETPQLAWRGAVG